MTDAEAWMVLLARSTRPDIDAYPFDTLHQPKRDKRIWFLVEPMARFAPDLTPLPLRGRSNLRPFHSGCIAQCWDHGEMQMDPVDLYNQRGREIAADREAERNAGGGVAPSDGSLFNGWVACWAILGFIAGQMSSQTLVGAFVGALTLAGISIAFQLVLRALGFAVGAGLSGLGALNAKLGALPQWILIGAIAGAACGAALAYGLDGNTYDLVGPAMRLAPVGAGIGFLLRLMMLAVKRTKS